MGSELRVSGLIALAVVVCAVSPVVAEKPAIVARELSERDLAIVRRIVDAQYSALFDLYRELHQNPELSYQERESARRVAAAVRAAGFEVTTGVGGHGVVGLLRNGRGPTVMWRCDLDALPVPEKTGLPYASKATAVNDAGETVPVMHACGHDVHMTCMVGLARVLAEMKDRWRGTVMLVGQPAEERGGGAEAMLKDGLFERFPRPNYALALHVSAAHEAGDIAYVPGYVLANVDSVDITIRGRGGHGAAPHTTVDPILLACRTVVALQSIVAREIKPIEDAVVTVGSIHGGTKHNIIPDEVKLQLTVRSFKDDVREQLRRSIERIARGEAIAAGAPEPEIRFGEGLPSTYNDPALVERCLPALQQMIGRDRVVLGEPSMGAEDFSLYGRAGVPAFMFSLGAVDPKVLERAGSPDAPPAPSLHSPIFAPVPEPTIKAGVSGAAAAVLSLLADPESP